MAQLIKVTRPTKIELIKLRRRLTLASRIQKLIKDRVSILVMEFLQIAGQTVEVKRGLLDDFSAMYKALSLAAGYHGYIALEKEFTASEGGLEIAAGLRNIGGVKIPAFELKKARQALRGYSLIDTSSWLDRTAELSEKCLEAIVELAELQRSMAQLGMEINRTKRIVNALEYLIIPSLQATIKYLNMKFEERDREEKSRLKRVKVLLERK
ncbi:MAG: V-type ATP synthase subunit D [Dehalococcoidales bacterium]|jgi:V/A-type H+-transporting ATPase subunit D|nr:V-type ATP synthase subunit D [Dehalococcoidales bacterium]